MKNFLIALSLLVLVVVFTVGNALFVENRMNALIELGEQNRCREAKEELALYEPLLSLTVHHVLLETLQTAAEELCIYPEDSPEHRAAMERFLSACKEVRAGEKFTFFNVF